MPGPWDGLIACVRAALLGTVILAGACGSPAVEPVSVDEPAAPRPSPSPELGSTPTSGPASVPAPTATVESASAPTPTAELAPAATSVHVPAAIDDPAHLELGSRVFARTCAGCHGSDGAGTVKGRSLIAVAVEQPDRLAHVNNVTHGRGDMAGFGHRFTPEEIDAVVSYVRLTFVADDAPVPADIGPGATTFLAQCAECHGATGTGTMQGRSLIGVANEARAEAHISSVTEGIGLMPGFENELSSDEIAEVVDYVRSTF